MPVFVQETLLAAPVDKVWAFHMEPDALRRLTPPDDDVTVVRFSPVKEGDTVELSIRARPLPLRMKWIARYANVEPPHRFVDVADHSPFRRWEHHHRFIAEGANTRMRDEVHWDAPLGALGNVFGGPFVEAMLRKQFTYRHRKLVELFGRA